MIRRPILGAGGSIGLAFLICAYVGLTACGVAGSDKPAVETELDNAKLLEAGLTPEDLARRTRPDLQWQDDDGARFFFWVKEQSDPRRYSFTMDRAYRLRHEGKVLWGFLDAKIMETWPAPEYLKLRHVRTTFEYPTKDHPDGNHTYAESLATRDNGATVFKIVYASRSGDRPHQEDMRTYLVYRAPAGGWQLAGRDIGHEGCSTGWSIGFFDATKIQVMWNTKPDSRPFTVRLKQQHRYYGRGEETADKSYEANREGVMEGPLPMRPRMERRQYVIADGTGSLQTLAARLAFFHSHWWDCPWVSAPQDAKRRIEAEWTAILEQANPELPANTPVETGRHIIIPDNEYATARSIFDTLKPLFEKPTRPSASD